MFVFSLLFLRLTTTTPFCLSPILRFNKADWFYLKFLLVWVFYTVKNALSHGLLTVFEDWYIYTYICVSDRDNLIVYHFGSLFSKTKWLCHDPLSFYSFFFSFHLEVTCSFNVFHLWCRGKKFQLRKPLLYDLIFK